jgi:microcystin-dependent protein
MSTQYVGQIKLVAFPRIPIGWAECDGQLLDKSVYGELFTVIGTTYGGDGVTTFALPDLRSRIPLGTSPDFPLGATGGEETHMLTMQEMASHGHSAQCNDSAGNQSGVSGGVWAGDSAKLNPPYRATTPNATMNGAAVGSAGGGQAHDNMQPFTTINYIIALYGVFPS